MCAQPSTLALKAIHKRTKPFTAWKMVYSNGCSFHINFQFKPGWNHAKTFSGKLKKTKTYNPAFPSGIHVYLNKPPNPSGLNIVPVTVNPKDVFVAEPSYNDDWSNPQLVCTKVHIDKAKWIKAGVKFGNVHNK